AHGRAADATAVADMSADYLLHVAVESTLFPDVLPVLTGLTEQGWHLAVCTNKPEQAARRLLDAVGLLPLLSAVGGGDSFPARKPDPLHLLGTLTLAGGQASAAVMVGDHRNDVQAARGAGIPSIFAAWGYATIDPGEANAVARDVAEAAAIANRILPAAG
ncbi:MAG TPA: HAD-IA family hydrolase, partial [Rhodopila sp.]